MRKGHAARLLQLAAKQLWPDSRESIEAVYAKLLSEKERVLLETFAALCERLGFERSREWADERVGKLVDWSKIEDDLMRESRGEDARQDCPKCFGLTFSTTEACEECDGKGWVPYDPIVTLENVLKGIPR